MTILPTVRDQIEQAAHRNADRRPRRARSAARIGGVLPAISVAAALAIGAVVVVLVHRARPAPAPAGERPHEIARLLSGDGIGAARFGESPATVATRLGTLFGPAVGARRARYGYRHAFCGFSWEQWAGLGAGSGTSSFVAQLTAWFVHGHFVGYDYAPDNVQTANSGWTQSSATPLRLATGRGLVIGDSPRHARLLYGAGFRVGTEAQGTPPNPRLPRLPRWAARTSRGEIDGPLGTVIVRRSGNSTRIRDSIVGISAGTSPNTPCRCPCTSTARR